MTKKTIALIDLDGTVADYDKSMHRFLATIRNPDESPIEDRYPEQKEPTHMEARRKLIQRQPGFWRNLEPLPMGFTVVHCLRVTGFDLHVLTKGPKTAPNAWSEKLEWATEHLPDATVHVSGDKSLVYGRILVDDWPPYFTEWADVRPRGLVICVAQPWNLQYVAGYHPNVLRYDGTNNEELIARIQRAHDL